MALRDRLDLIRAKDLLLGTFLERLSVVYDDKRLVAEKETGLELTYRQAADRVARWAGGIRTRIDPGDRVVVAVPNGYELVLLCQAVARAGGVAVPINPKMRDEEIRHIIEDSGATLTIHEPAEVDAQPIAQVPGISGSDTAVLFYTSGTTGKPKGAQLTHRALVGSAGGGAGVPPIINECVTGMPLAHIAGFAGVVQMAAMGVPVYLLNRFRPTDAMDAIETRKPAMFVGVPAMFRMMEEAGAEHRNLESVRIWSSGADVMPTDLAKKFQTYGGAMRIPFTRKTVGLAGFVDGYGMVELGGGVAMRFFPPGISLPFGGMVRPMRGNELKVVDDAGNDVPRGEVGELVVKGPSVMKGYHGRDEATRDAMTADGWLRTGDLAKMHKGGFFEFAGRKKDVIKHGGYSVFAVEVEATLGEHPAVAEAAVLGLPDERKGEIPVAVIRLHEGASATEEEIIAFSRERLSEYKVPQKVRFAVELPRTGTEKVRKTGLRPLFDG